LLHSAIKDLAFAALNKTFCLPVEMKDWAAKGLYCTHRADRGTAEGTTDALCEFCASLVIEKRHYYIIISPADKIELAFKCNPIMVRRKGAVRSVRHTAFDLPVYETSQKFNLVDIGDFFIAGPLSTVALKGYPLILTSRPVAPEAAASMRGL
jgi:hypothetical protein